MSMGLTENLEFNGSWYSKVYILGSLFERRGERVVDVAWLHTIVKITCKL